MKKNKRFSTPKKGEFQVKEIITQRKEKSRKKIKKNRSFQYIKIRARLDNRRKSTSYGGIGLAHSLVKQLGLAEEIDKELHIFKQYHDYSESDHILLQVYNLYSGGERLEDVRNIRNNKGIKNLLKTGNIPSPSTAGDFLRRFVEDDIWLLQEIKLRKSQQVWEINGSKRKTITVDTDSTIKELYGQCQDGADFSHNGKWSYHPELITISELNEIIAVKNRPGNVVSGDGVAEMLGKVYPALTSSFRKVRHRGDTKYGRRDIIKKDEEYGVEFFLGYASCKKLREEAASLQESEWVEIMEESGRVREKKKPKSSRRKRRRYRKEAVVRRGYKDKETVARSVAEIRYKPSWSDKDYRMMIVRHRVTTKKGGKFLFDLYKYYFIITSNETWSKKKVVNYYYGRDNQENIIKELKNDFAGLWMPTGELLSNWAWMVIASLAWSLKSWLCQIGFKEGLRWMWKRFRHEFVYINACFHKGARQINMIIDGCHRFAEKILLLLQKIEQLEFG